jgi:hypothetical protein
LCFEKERELEKYVSSAIVILHKIIFRLFCFEKENDFCLFYTCSIYKNFGKIYFKLGTTSRYLKRKKHQFLLLE